jgi:hypothetical protein
LCSRHRCPHNSRIAAQYFPQQTGLQGSGLRGNARGTGDTLVTPDRGETQVRGANCEQVTSTGGDAPDTRVAQDTGTGGASITARVKDVHHGVGGHACDTPQTGGQTLKCCCLLLCIKNSSCDISQVNCVPSPAFGRPETTAHIQVLLCKLLIMFSLLHGDQAHGIAEWYLGNVGQKLCSRQAACDSLGSSSLSHAYHVSRHLPAAGPSSHAPLSPAIKAIPAHHQPAIQER